jgi:hypothetical protein
MNWDYDRDFELLLAGTDQKRWVEYVWKVRDTASAHGLRVTVSPRASIEGALMLRNGISLERVKNVRLFNAMAKADREKILANIRY